LRTTGLYGAPVTITSVRPCATHRLSTIAGSRGGGANL
jgi:hypothetical protein